MSKREVSRRQFCKRVMKYAWLLFKRNGGWCYGFAKCLKLAWRRLRGSDNSSYTRIVGTTFNNSVAEGGANRQSLIAELSNTPNDQVSLGCLRDPNNNYDPNAIAIVATIKGKGSAPIGYLSRNDAAKIAPLIDLGSKVAVLLENIVGGGAFNYGVNISYFLWE